MEPHRCWTIVSSRNFLRRRWLIREQELITVIQEETKCTEEWEEAGWFGTGQGKKTKSKRPFRADGKEIFSNCSKQAKASLKAGKKMDKKGGKGQSVRWKAWCRQSNIKCAVSDEYASCWVHQDCHKLARKKANIHFCEWPRASVTHKQIG